MTEQERINQQLQRQIDMQGGRIDALGVKIDAFIEESRLARARQDEDMREIRQDMKTMQTNLDAKIDALGKHVQNLSVAAMVGVGTSVIAVVVMVGTMVYAILTR